MTTQMDTPVKPADEHEETPPVESSTDIETPAVEETVAKDLNAILIRAAVADRNADRMGEAAQAAKADVVKVLGREASLPVMNPLNPKEEFVKVTVSKLTYSATTMDRPATVEWVKEHYSDKVEKKTRFVPGTTERDVFNVLRQFAPYLLEEIDVVPDHVIQELERKSRHARQPMGFGGEVGENAPPGIVVTPSTPQVRITFRKVDVVDDLIACGIVDMEGNLLGGDE